MITLTTRKLLVILGHAFIGWALCTASMMIGMAVTTLDTALIVHAIGAPVFFFGVSLVYFTKFNYTSPLQTALIFVGFVIFMDFFLIALVINQSLEMFTSLLGTWIPFVLIFLSTSVTGLVVTRQQTDARPA